MNDASFPEIKSPCLASWEKMHGTESKRFCAECQLSVVNISLLTVAERQKLLAENKGRLCVRYYRDLNGNPISAEQLGPLAKTLRTAATFSLAALPMLMAGCTQGAKVPQPIANETGSEAEVPETNQEVHYVTLGNICAPEPPKEIEPHAESPSSGANKTQEQPAATEMRSMSQEELQYLTSRSAITGFAGDIPPMQQFLQPNVGQAFGRQPQIFETMGDIAEPLPAQEEEQPPQDFDQYKAGPSLGTD